MKLQLILIIQAAAAALAEPDQASCGPSGNAYSLSSSSSSDDGLDDSSDSSSSDEDAAQQLPAAGPLTDLAMDTVST